MVSTKAGEKTVPEIESKLKLVGGDLVKIEYLENCLKQIVPNDVARFCHLKLAELYQLRLMLTLAIKHMDAAAEAATTNKDKIDLYLKEITLMIKVGDYMTIDRPFKKAMASANNMEKELIKKHLKAEFFNQASEYEKKQTNRKAVEIYERIMDLSVVTDDERKDIMKRLAVLNNKLGRIRESMNYEHMATKPIEKKRSRDDDGQEVRKVSYEDLGIDFY